MTDDLGKSRFDGLVASGRMRELEVVSEDPQAGTLTVSGMHGTIVVQTSYPFVPGSVRAYERLSADEILLKELLG